MAPFRRDVHFLGPIHFYFASQNTVEMWELYFSGHGKNLVAYFGCSAGI